MVSTTRRRRLLLWVLALVPTLKFASGFIITHVPPPVGSSCRENILSTTTVTITFTTRVQPSSSAMQMVAKKGKKPKATTTTTSSSSSSGGFGDPTTTASSAPKVRTVSGFTGSGTKPLRQAANTFDTLRKEFGVEACRDVYVRAPHNDPQTFWFVGKIAIRLSNKRDDDDDDDDENTLEITPSMAIWSQKRLILEYAKHQLRPQNLAGKFSKDQEIWLAPGDSEMEVVRNIITLEKVTGSSSDLPDGFVVKNNVGFNPEIYVGEEVQKGGLRVVRDPETGAPIKPVFDVNESV